MSRPLEGRVALVAGATRGAGRGIAVALGEAGATVYCTGRSTRERPVGVRPPGDHRGDRRAGRRRRRHRHRGGGRPPRAGAGRARWCSASTPTTAGSTCWSTTSGAARSCSSGTRRVWEHDLDAGLRMLRLAVETHLVTSHFALPLLIRRPGGLVVEMTDGTRAYNDVALPRERVLRPGQGLGAAAGLRPGARSWSRTAAPRWRSRPGWLRSEMMLEVFGVTEENWDEPGKAPPHFAAISESPRFVGRAVAALAADPDAGEAATAARSPPASWRASTASPTWTARSPTAGATWSRCRTRASPRTRPATASAAAARAHALEERVRERPVRLGACGAGRARRRRTRPPRSGRPRSPARARPRPSP